MAQLLHLPSPAGGGGQSPRVWGKGGLSDSQGSTGASGGLAGVAVSDPVADVQAIVTDIVKSNKASYDKGMKAAMIELVSPSGDNAIPAGRQIAGSSSSSSLEIDRASISIPDRETLEAMDPSAVRQLALDVGISAELVSSAAPPRQVDFEEFAQFLETLVSSAGAGDGHSWSVTSPRPSPRGRPDTPDHLQIDAPFHMRRNGVELNNVPYTVTRHLRPVSEWGLDVDLPGAERPDGITWEAAGALLPQFRPNITEAELENGLILSQTTPRMETVNRDSGSPKPAPVARPPKEARVYKGPASLRGRQMRVAGTGKLSSQWKQ